MNSSVALIDTLGLMGKAKPTSEQLKLLWLKREDSICDADPKLEYYYNAGKQDEIQVRATYRPKGRLCEDQFSVEFSLLKLTLGNNYETTHDFAAAIEIVDAKFAQVRAFPPLRSIADMIVSRMDPCYNYLVGPLLPDYIAAIGMLDYPHRDTVRVNAETVEFRAKSVKCKFYDKFSECHEEGARGLLRHEITLHRASAVKAALGKRRGTVHLKDITPEICKHMLEEDLRRLGLLDQPLGNFDAAELALVAAYSPSRASRLLYILDKYRRSGRAGLVSSLGHTRNFINRSLLDIRKAGVPLALTESEHPLPPLEVEL